MSFFIQGFLLGLAYVAPIGMQNMFVINAAMVKRPFGAYQVAFITVFFDISLALAAFFGMGLIMAGAPLLKGGILLVGGIAVVFIGIALIRSTPDLGGEVDLKQSPGRLIFAIFAVTWLNPQALIDGSLLLGGMKAAMVPEAARFFITGVVTASFTWFVGITTVILLFKNIFSKKILRGINVISGGVIILYGVRLIVSFLGMVL